MTLHPTFEPLYFGDQLTVVNPSGTIGVVTLWSRVDHVLREMERGGVCLDPRSSPIAVLGTLYGNGLREMLRNLLYNPQIDTLLVLGRNRSGSAEELAAFFGEGLEPYASEHLAYQAEEGCPPVRAMRIRGTNRIIDSLVTPGAFERPPHLAFFGKAQGPPDMREPASFLNTYRPSGKALPERRRIPLPRVEVSSFPSNPRQHSILAPDLLTAWKELVHRIHRFGLPVHLAKGERRELQNVKVVVENTREASLQELDRYGFSPALLAQYRENMLNGMLQEDETYTYGHRMRTHFGLDCLDRAAERLREDPEDRKAYVALWDTSRDLLSPRGHPCLVSLFFRRLQGKLTLTAVFRTHNALDAWLVNGYGLGGVLEHVAGLAGMKAGAITVFSHSITLDAGRMDRAVLIAAEAESRYREDPMGYFRITLDGDAILAQHRSGDITLGVYRHPKAVHIQHEICRDRAISDLNHAMYLGRQLARAEECLREGREFVQE